MIDGSSDPLMYWLSIKAKLNGQKSKLPGQKCHTEYLTNVSDPPHHQIFTKISKGYPLEEKCFNSFLKLTSGVTKVQVQGIEKKWKKSWTKGPVSAGTKQSKTWTIPGSCVSPVGCGNNVWAARVAFI